MRVAPPLFSLSPSKKMCGVCADRKKKEERKGKGFENGEREFWPVGYTNSNAVLV